MESRERISLNVSPEAIDALGPGKNIGRHPAILEIARIRSAFL